MEIWTTVLANLVFTVWIVGGFVYLLFAVAPSDGG